MKFTKVRARFFQIYIILWVTFFCALACTRSVPTVSPKLRHLEYLETPQEIHPGELALVVLQVPSGAQCDMSFSYQLGGEWKWQRLETRTADAEGTCSWEWRIPLDASPGEAGFRNDVRYEGESRSLPPRTFEIVENKK